MNKKNILFLAVISLTILLISYVFIQKNTYSIDKLLGQFNQNTYSNKYFDFKVTVPNKWILNEGVSIEFLNSRIKELKEEEIKGALLFIASRDSIKSQEYSKGIAVDCSATRITHNFKTEAYNQMNDLILLDDLVGYVKEKEIEYIDINGKSYYICNTINNKKHRTYLFTESNGFIIKFIFKYDQVNKKIVEDVINSIDFYKK